MLSLSSLDERFKRWMRDSWIATIIKVVTILIVVVNAFFDFVERRDEAVNIFFDKCYLLDPSSGKPDKTKPKRDCVFGQISFFKWTDPNQEGDSDLPAVGQQVVDRPNRVLQIVDVVNGQVVWGQQKLVRVENGKETWQPAAGDRWIPVNEGATLPHGFVLRDIQNNPRCAGIAPDDLRKTPVQLNEFFIASDAEKSLQETGTAFVYYRPITFFCDQEIGSGFRFGPSFGPSDFRLTQVVSDDDFRPRNGILHWIATPDSR